MNERDALELERALSRRFPGGEVTVTAQDDGALIVIETPGQSRSLSIGDASPVLLGCLLGGYAD